MIQNGGRRCSLAQKTFSFVRERDLQIASQYPVSTASFSGRSGSPRYDTVMSKKKHSDNLSAVPVFRSTVCTVRECLKCYGTDIY